jgi:chemotaxis protein CheD
LEQVVVGMADCRVGDDPNQVLTTYALGSCIGLIVHDPVARVGGLLHFMLPDSSIGPEQAARTPFRFADTGIPLLLQGVLARGASKRRLNVTAVGGAQLMDPDGFFDIGKRNYAAARRVLWKAGILVSAESVGGTCYRTVRLEIGAGRVLLQEGGKQVELASSRAGKGEWNGLPALNCR